MPYRQWHYVVNPLSGGRRGGAILQQLQGLVTADRVVDIRTADFDALFASCTASGKPLIVVGGDGSVSGILSQIAERGLEIPVGVLPLGTGNDLSRSLGLSHWQPGDIGNTLATLATFQTQRIDRWRLRGPGTDSYWYNYCSIGADARIAYQFHNLRDRHPAWFRSASLNRLWYAGLGMVDRPRSLRKALKGCLAEILPADSRSLVLTNIDSYAGGTCLDRRIDARDGRFELMVLPDGLSLVLRLTQLRPTNMLGRRSALRFSTREALHLQIDGEAQRCRPGVYTIVHAGQVAVLAKGAECSTMPSVVDIDAA